MDLTNRFVLVYLIFLVLSMLTRFVLDILNYLYRRKRSDNIPDMLKEYVDNDKLKKMNSYSDDKTIYGTVTKVIDTVVLLILLFTGFFPWLYNSLIVLTENPYVLCFLFFASISLIETAASVPYSLYFNFVIEKKYGFNKLTAGLWISDFFKEIIISLLISILILIPVVFVLTTFTKIWWILLWGIFVILALLMQIIYPVFIAPLFNNFKPIENEELKNAVEDVLVKSGYKSEGVFEMDASKRSGHSNAYFTGIGKTKKIVLFDTLISHADSDEIAAVLAHEIGHYKKKHNLKSMILSFAVTLLVLYAAYLIMNSDYIFRGFGFLGIIPSDAIYIGLFLVSIVSGPVMFFTKPIFSALSRKNEYEADKYSAMITGKPEALYSALIKLNVKNLSNIYPSPLYVSFYYSHPPLIDRILRLKSLK